MSPQRILPLIITTLNLGLVACGDDSGSNPGTPITECETKPHATSKLEGQTCVYTCDAGYLKNDAGSCVQVATCEGLKKIRVAGADGQLQAAEDCPTSTPYCVQPDPKKNAQCVARNDLLFKFQVEFDNDGEGTKFKVTDGDPAYAPSDFDIDWDSDGTYEDTAKKASASEFTHTYTKKGKYTVTIRGLIQGIEFTSVYPLPQSNLISVTSWGKNPWRSMSAMFIDCMNLKTVDATPPYTKNTTNMSAAFNNADTFEGDVRGWDTSNVTNMKDMFRDTRLFKQDLSGWNVAKVTDHQDFNTNSGLSKEHLPKFPTKLSADAACGALDPAPAPPNSAKRGKLTNRRRPGLVGLVGGGAFAYGSMVGPWMPLFGLSDRMTSQSPWRRRPCSSATGGCDPPRPGGKRACEQASTTAPLPGKHGVSMGTTVGKLLDPERATGGRPGLGHGRAARRRPARSGLGAGRPRPGAVLTGRS